MIKLENTEVTGLEAAVRGMRNPLNSWDKSDSFVCLECEEMTDDEIDATCGRRPRNVETCEIYDRAPHFIIGCNDLDLMTRLRNAGTDHRKFMRMITVYCDITAPLYWWKEFDTYKVGTVANSCSTMHRIADKEFTWDDFSHEHLVSGWTVKDKNNDNIILPGPTECMENTIAMLNRVRNSYLVALRTESETGLPAKDIWWQMIQLLPSSYNQRRTVMLNYEVLANIYKSRKNHKLDEWRVHETPEEHKFRNKDFASGRWGFCDWIINLPYSGLITGKDNLE